MFLNPASGANDGLVAAAADAGLEVVGLRRELDVPAMVRERMRDGKRLFFQTAAARQRAIHEKHGA